MSVTGISEIKAKRGKIRGTVTEVLERNVQAQSVLIFMQGRASFAAKDSCKMKRRAENRAGQYRERQFLAEFPGKHHLRSGDELAMSVACCVIYCARRLILFPRRTRHALRQ